MHGTLRTATLALLGALFGCGTPAPEEGPWFCAVQGADHDDALKLMERRMGPRTPGAARAVLEGTRWRGCWGNAALVLGASAVPEAEALVSGAIDRVAADPRSDLEADALLAALGLTVRSSDEARRIEAVVGALVQRADPRWWAARAPSSDTAPAETRAQAETRARAALFGLAYSGTQRAATALEALRDAPPGAPDFNPPSADVFSAALRQNRLYRRQPPGAIAR